MLFFIVVNEFIDFTHVICLIIVFLFRIYGLIEIYLYIYLLLLLLIIYVYIYLFIVGGKFSLLLRD